ncbi:MAG: molybdopterin-guanine dinucleotide biosynthesis protein B [Lachnospiraceae bacterium]|nr:molybdopterin-guanine dinucleotide biosynthesis protein B [Lachnospiraceae bacterium]
MTDIPIIGLAGYSGSGKTTLLEKVIPLLAEKGLRAAVIKHDVHGLDLDGEGTDSRRFAEAGAVCTVASSTESTSIFISRPLSLSEAAACVRDADIILVEGYKNADIPQIGLARAANGKGFTADISRFIALVTDIPQENADMPVFAFDEYEKIAGFIADRIR